MAFMRLLGVSLADLFEPLVDGLAGAAEVLGAGTHGELPLKVEVLGRWSITPCSLARIIAQ